MGVVMALVPQRINIPIGGGLAQNETPEYLDPPALFQCDNMYHRQKTDLIKRPGYNCYQVCVDGRAATVESWLASVNTPLITVSTDRFIKTEAGATFAARGWLWSYYGDLFNACNEVSPSPNCVRHCEIPDMKTDADITFGISDGNPATGLQVIDASSAAHELDFECSTFLLHDLSGKYEWRVRLTCRSTGDLLIGKTLLQTYGETFDHVCCLAYPQGFIVTCYNVTEKIIECFRYTVTSAKFTQVPFPDLTLHDPQGWGTMAPRPDWYDLCGTASNDFHIGWIVASGSYIPDIHGGSGGDVSVNFSGGIFAATIDATTMTIKYGGYFMGSGAMRQTGCLTYSPFLAVAGDEVGNYAVAWIDNVQNRVFVRAAYQQTRWASALSVSTIGPSAGRRVGLTRVVPMKQVDVFWNVIWEYRDTNLGAGGDYLTSVRSQTLGATGAMEYVPRDYWASHIISQPWHSMGNCYAVLATSQPVLANADQPPGAWYADQPYVLARLWCDQDTDDVDSEYKNYQMPMAVWGYGTVKLPIQPFRILGSPKFNYTSRKTVATGSIVISDPFLQGYGVSVQRLSFDPCAPERYSSAALPGGGSIFGCSNPWIFDGDRAFEAAFVHRPWFITYATAAGGTLEDDTVVDGAAHYLKIMYEHQDAKGRITRSPPSTTVSISTTSTGQKITLTVIPPFWSARAPGTTVLKIYMCRDDISFKLVGNIPVAVWWIGSMPTMLEYEIGAEPNPISPYIYTYDGVIESGYGHFADHVCRWDNRIWLMKGNKISYSQEFISGDGPSFPDSFTEYVDSEVSAVTPFDDRLVLFHSDAIAYRNGEGPRENGQGSNYSKWNYFTHDVGCVNPRSLVRTQIGAFFQSRRRIEFLDTSCKITHQLAVETAFSGTSDLSTGQIIIGGLSLPKNHQVRLLYVDGSVLKQLVIDYETMTWSRWYGAYPWVAAMDPFFGDIGIDGDDVYVIDGYGQIFAEVEYLHHDTNVPPFSAPTRKHVDWNVTTPWIKIDGLQGVQMVWNSMVMLRVAEWYQPAIAQVPQFGVNISIDVDYQNTLELHGSKTAKELLELREPSDLTYLQVGHINPLCSAYQIQLSSSDSTEYNYSANVTGVYGIVGIWSELAVEPGTGRKRAESRM